MEKITTIYRAVTNKMIQSFIKEYFDLEYSLNDVDNSFVGLDWTGEVFMVSDYYFNVYDAYYALSNNVCRADLFDWYDYVLSWQNYEHYINLKSWVNGCPRRTPEQLIKMQKAEADMQLAQEEFHKLIDEFNKSK